MSARDNPFEMLERMFEQMSRQFDEVGRSWDGEWAELPEFGRRTMGIDLAERDDEFVVTADVPGFEKEHIDLRMRDHTLHITARREQTVEEREENYLRSEREHRTLRDTVRIPDPVDEDAISAALKNGVLTVRLPKADPTEASGRQIDIE